MLNVEITNKCQLKCPGCLRQLQPEKLRGTREHSFDTLKVIFDTFPRINFCGQISDPIYHREFHKILEYIPASTELHISTGGQGKTPEWWTKSFELTKGKKVRWVFGIDGLPKDSHKYRVGQDGEQVFEMMKLGVEIGVSVTWQYIVFNYNEHDIEEAKQMAKDNNMRFLMTLSNRYNNDLMMSYKPENEMYIAGKYED